MANPLFLLLLLAAGKGGKSATALPAFQPRTTQSRPPAPRPRPPAPRPIQLTREVVIPAALTDTTFPGPRWQKVSPVTQKIAQRASELLPVLWQKGEGTGIVEDMGDRLIGFLSEYHGPKKGVSAWRLKTGTIVTAPKAAPKAAPKPAPKKAAPAPRPAPVKAPPPKPRRKKKPPAPAPKPAPKAEIVRVVEPAPAPPPAQQEADESEYPFALRPDKPVLMQGSSGPAVEELQILLGIGGTRGFYGPMTVDRVKKYQAANNLPVDGKTGEITWGSLLA